jgi:glycine amidinotransferase
MPAEPPIHVRSEWAPLEECVYGRPDRWVLPVFHADAKLRAWGPFHAFWEANQGRDMAEADPERFRRFREQIEGAIRFLERRGVRVHVAGEVSPANRRFPRGENHGVATGWMRDPFVTIAENVIELAPRSLFHRRQRFAIRSILAATMERGARYFAQPDGGADDGVDGTGWGYLEGGDIFVLDDVVLVGHGGGCSNPEGARWLQHVLGPGFSVRVVPIDPMFPHLDCVLMTPREGLAVACLEAFSAGLPEPLRDWEIIDVPKAVAKTNMGCNHLVLDDRNVLLPSETAHDPVADALRARGFEVMRLPYEGPCEAGGSFRCAHQPLRRP